MVESRTVRQFDHQRTSGIPRQGCRVLARRFHSRGDQLPPGERRGQEVDNQDRGHDQERHEGQELLRTRRCPGMEDRNEHSEVANYPFPKVPEQGQGQHNGAGGEVERACQNVDPRGRGRVEHEQPRCRQHDSRRQQHQVVRSAVLAASPIEEEHGHHPGGRHDPGRQVVDLNSAAKEPIGHHPRKQRPVGAGDGMEADSGHHPDHHGNGQDPVQDPEQVGIGIRAGPLALLRGRRCRCGRLGSLRGGRLFRVVFHGDLFLAVRRNLDSTCLPPAE